ncbi:hypothetical protein [Plebeiibacterium marinum]|uniref:Uncharacterized protein n=1 Tax=Plebeiibacterium marinum TaxID=2992111 RepID=A0AAE3SJU4_9BACT|nr:hypothetical protein [Plebeiobacterium marinum]MCW3806120.1 hypothetical protein [Plebeiobacterium marinum]
MSKFIDFLIQNSDTPFVDSFYINQDENNCAYFETFGFQISFHNIHVSDDIAEFMSSENNRIKDWRGIKLQKVSVSLKNYAESIKKGIVCA